MTNTVTVQGARSATLTLTYDSSANAALAQYIVTAITAGIKAGAITTNDSLFSGNQPLPPPAGKTSEWVQDTPAIGVVTMPKGDDNFLANSFFDVFTDIDVGQNILAGTASGTVISANPNAAGNIVMGGGNDNVIIQSTDIGPWLIQLGNGQDVVKALGSGADTISLGTGADSVLLGAGNSVVTTAGSATISASSIGGSNVSVTGMGTTVIYGNSSNLTFIAGGGATVYGGTGSDTVTGGGGPDYFQGGTAGKNVLTAGIGAATLFGGGSGDRLFATGGSNHQILFAASGNETLTGSSSPGAADTFVGSAGSTTVVVSTNASNLFEFIHGTAGGNVAVTGLNDVGQIAMHLLGYSANDTSVLTHNSVSGGNLSVTLQDGTQITFANITQPLTNNNFS
jgi:Ca2+-binding RTX toxin-like protein